MLPETQMDSSSRQPVLVTGASGFIGRRLVRRLIDGHHRVFCLVRANSSIEDLRSAGAQPVTGDVTDRGSTERAIIESQAGLVFHLAGLVKAGRRDDLMRVNVGGVDSVAASCADRSRPPTLVIVSSLAAAGPNPAAGPRMERDDPAPVSNYGRSKLAGESAATAYAGIVPIIIVRPPIVFGPGDRGVLNLFRPIARWGLHPVPGWADHRLSLIHADDLVEGLTLAAEMAERLLPLGPTGRGIYFLAGQENPTYTELGQAIAVALGRKRATVLRVPGPLLRLLGISADAVARIRRNHRGAWISTDKITEALAGSWTCSSDKARSQLGWSPAATLAVRLHETALWYRHMGWL